MNDVLKASVEFVWWGGGGGVGWVLHSNFHVQPNYSVEVVLCCHWGCGNLFETCFMLLKINTC